MSEFFYTYGTRTSFFVISEIHGCWIARMTEQILISGFLQEIRDIFLFAMLFLKWRSRNNSCIQYEQIRLVFEEIGLWWILFNCEVTEGQGTPPSNIITNIRDTFFTLILKYLLPAPWIDYLEHLEHFYGIRSKSFIVKDLEISLQRFHITNITYKTRCEMLHNINSLDSSDGRVIGFHPQG